MNRLAGTVCTTGCSDPDTVCQLISYESSATGCGKSSQAQIGHSTENDWKPRIRKFEWAIFITEETARNLALACSLPLMDKDEDYLKQLGASRTLHASKRRPDQENLAEK